MRAHRVPCREETEGEENYGTPGFALRRLDEVVHDVQFLHSTCVVDPVNRLKKGTGVMRKWGCKFTKAVRGVNKVSALCAAERPLTPSSPA